ncbi:MAG: hypothetical protein D6690_04615 [Nitrospirae bacterium]|nr:MAG: hypothetical protein D6690_04615 [Nitrospirota bacterium]
MEIDIASLRRIRAFMDLLMRAKEAGAEVTFHNTPTEHGDNITALVTLDGERRQEGLVFWDVTLLQEQGLADVLDDDELALGMSVADGLLEDAERILLWAESALQDLESA